MRELALERFKKAKREGKDPELNFPEVIYRREEIFLIKINYGFFHVGHSIHN